MEAEKFTVQPALWDELWKKYLEIQKQLRFSKLRVSYDGYGVSRHFGTKTKFILTLIKDVINFREKRGKYHEKKNSFTLHNSSFYGLFYILFKGLYNQER